MQSGPAEALVRIHQKLRADGLGLVIFDGYRPWSVTKLFWETVVPEHRIYVADPAIGSKHNRGCAVDLSLYDLKTGVPLPMPSGYDEFTQRSSPNYQGGTQTETTNRERLRAAMEAADFTINPEEWWHFDHKDWKNYPIYDVSFDNF